MNTNTLKLIAAATAALAGSTAYALPPTATPAYIIYAGGGSAQQQAVIWMMDQLLSNNDFYSQTGCNTAQDGSYQIAFGTLKNAVSGVPAGTNVLIEYKFNGGSFPNGVQPEGLGSTLPYPNSGVVSGATACSSQTYPLPTYSIAAGAATTASFVPDWGLSDVEPKLLNTPYNVPGTYSNGAFTPGPTLTSAQLGNVKATGIYENLFGIAVTTQVTTASCPKTNFSKTEMVGVLDGLITDWSQLQGDGGCAIAAGPITLIDRAPGSGTKASGSLYFLNYPNPYFEVPGNINYGTVGTLCDGSYDDINASSNGNIVASLNTAGGENCRAIAILGGEFPPALHAPSLYAFEKISNVDPGFNSTTTIPYTTEISGDYDFFYTNSFNYRTATVGSNPQHYSGDGTFNGNAISTVKALFQSSSIPSGVPGSTSVAPSGVLLDPAVVKTLKTCTTRGTHNLTSQNPLSLYFDFSSALPATACSDTV